MRLSISLLLALLVCELSWAQIRRPASIPVVQTIGDGMIWRESENRRPPWKRITIANIFGFKKRPVVGETVTVIVLRSEIRPFGLRILKTKKIVDPCDERLPPWWDVELEPLKQKILFDVAPPPDRNAEYPFDVVILYPAVNSARQIRKDQLELRTLPRGVVIDTLKAAIDLNDDRKADIVVTEYCCLDAKKRANECDLTCGKTFKRAGNLWKVVNTTGPC